jgi:transcriptional regulator with PAS, ATPase and Fis domain
MDKNSLLDKLPLGVIVTDNHNKIKYFNNYVSNHISSDVSLLESELINAMYENRGGRKKSKSGVRSLSINTRIFRLKFFETKFDDDYDKAKWIILLFDSNEFFDFDNELGETNKLVNRLQSIIDFSYDGIYVTDHMGTTLCVNKSYERITGVKIDEVIGRNIKELEVIGMF